MGRLFFVWCIGRRISAETVQISAEEGEVSTEKDGNHQKRGDIDRREWKSAEEGEVSTEEDGNQQRRGDIDRREWKSAEEQEKKTIRLKPQSIAHKKQPAE
ncbi:hypothetical protein [Lentibacillus jeotgali]|uniref:hypothetical protein n=1 Tax=Lentibacillus jeotgali TaxID=558169 RepID=UPI0002E6590F|nr:hypothetical protein [Lentibacillus jeotgali]